MRRFCIMLLAIAMAFVIALPAGADKPEKLPKPPKPPTAVPIAVFMDAEPVWVHEAADIIKYHVTLENKTSEPIHDVWVEFTAAVPAEKTEAVDIPANGSVGMGFWRTVSEYAEAGACEVGDECSLPASAAVFVAGALVTQAEMSVPLMPEPSCDFTYDWVGGEADGVWAGTREKPLSGVCIWTPGPDWTGIWKVTLDPTPPKNAARPIGAAVAVRDGVPGNWCTLPDGSGGVFSARWKVGDPPVVGEVYLPGNENILDLAFDPIYGGGTCLAGGAGGEYFMVGNPDSFYLRAEGTVTVEFVETVVKPVEG